MSWNIVIFPKSLQSPPAEVENPPEYIKILQNSNLEITNTPPSQEEISIAIKQLNNEKSSVDIEAEVVKMADSIPEFKCSLENYFNKTWADTQVPNQWRRSRITSMLKKKGNTLNPAKYRGVSIGSVLCKIGMNGILKRLSAFYDQQLKTTQFGFGRGVGCNDGIYMVKQLQEIASASQRELFVCFVDLSSAFDHVNRKLLFKTVRNRLPDNSN